MTAGGKAENITTTASSRSFNPKMLPANQAKLGAINKRVSVATRSQPPTLSLVSASWIPKVIKSTGKAALPSMFTPCATPKGSSRLRPRKISASPMAQTTGNQIIRCHTPLKSRTLENQRPKHVHHDLSSNEVNQADLQTFFFQSKKCQGQPHISSIGKQTGSYKAMAQ